MYLIKYIKYLLFILMLYFFFFQPQMKAIGLDIPSSWLLYPIAILLLLFETGKKWAYFFKNFKTEIVVIILIFSYTLLRVLLGGDVETLKKNFLSIFELVLVPYSIIVIGNKLRLNTLKDFFNVFFITGTVAIGMSILCLLIPDLHNYVRESVMIYEEDDYLYNAAFRGFGVAAQLTSHYAYALGIMVSLSLFYRGSMKWFIYVIPLAFITMMVNARTGVLVGAAGFFVFFFRSSKKTISSFFLILGIVLFVYFNDILSLFNISGTTATWVNEFSEEMGMILEGNADKSVMSVYRGMIVFPETVVDWILGMGISIFHGGTVNNMRVNSDIGFINQLLFGGIIYIALLYYLVYYMSKRLRRTGNKEYSLYLIVIFLIINFKGDFLPYTPSFKLVMLTYYIVILNYFRPMKRLPQNSAGEIPACHIDDGRLHFNN